MIKLSKSQSSSIVLAILLSVLIHLALLFTPMIELAPTEIPLPPLQAKLEDLPKLAPVAVPKRPVTPKPKPKPKVAEALPPPPAERGMAESSPPLTPETTSPEITAEEVQPDAVPAELPAPSAHPLPKHAQLTFSVYKSGTSFAIGEAQHRLDIDDQQHYTIRTSATTTGVVRLLKRFEMVQTSTGAITPYGLQPSRFVEDKITSDGTDTHIANFDWSANSVHYSAGNSAALPKASQDIVSFMYQLSQLQWGGNPLSIPISNGKKLESYQIEVGEEELIDTPMGKLRAIPMRKVHGPNEEGLDIWLAVEYRLLPIKITQLERDGSVAGLMLISDIRVAD